MTFADELRLEQEALARRFVFHTRPRGTLSLDEARALSERMELAAPRALILRHSFSNPYWWGMPTDVSKARYG